MLPFAASRRPLSLTVYLGALALLAGCGGDSNGPNPPAAQGRTIYAVDLANHFALFHSGSPGTVDRDIPITGLLTGDRIVGIDFRPADGKLYGVGTDSRLYVVDTVTAVASPVGTTFTPTLAGDHFGVALDGATDRIRVQSAETGQNLTLDPATGEVASDDATLTYAPGDANEAVAPEIAALAVTGGATYGIDWFHDLFVVMSNPSDGQITTVGSTGVSTAACAALDAASDGVIYASMTINGINNLYTMNVSTGAATSLGPIDQVASIQSIAVVPGAAAAISSGMASQLPSRVPAGLRRSQSLGLVTGPAKVCS